MSLWIIWQLRYVAFFEFFRVPSLPFSFLPPPPFLPFLARQVGGLGLCFREWIPPCGDDAKLFEHAPIRFPFILVTASSVGFASHSLSTSLRTHRAFACTALRCSLHVPLSLQLSRRLRRPYSALETCTVRYMASMYQVCCLADDRCVPTRLFNCPTSSSNGGTRNLQDNNHQQLALHNTM